MIASAVYVLCAVTSAFCATLLFRQYRRSRARLLFWSSLAFAGFALNNVLVFADLVVLPSVDLSLLRTLTALGAVSLLLYGLVVDAA
ncbi:MAG TPA: DUF5985 family protein [Vicinamibacterales bacterium]|nr:DUF5985 family protein [Vicinamibacterales bacterium]